MILLFGYLLVGTFIAGQTIGSGVLQVQSSPVSDTALGLVWTSAIMVLWPVLLLYVAFEVTKDE